jgi:hypothetical protein
MDVPDQELARVLEVRDGPLGSAWRAHRDPGGPCHYAELYPDGDCPWCKAQDQREAAGTAPSPTRTA